MSDWFEKTTLGALPEQAERLYGEREALCFEGRRCTFRELRADIDRAARGLMALGIQPGEKVALWLNNRPEWIHLMFAVVKIGAVLVPVNTRLRAREVSYILKQSNSTTLIAADRSGPVDYLSMVRELLPGLAEADSRSLTLAAFPDLRRVVLLSGEPEPGSNHWPRVLEGAGEVSAPDLAARAAAVDPGAIAYIL